MSNVRAFYMWDVGARAVEGFWVPGVGWQKWEELPAFVQTRLAVLKTLPSELTVPGVGRRNGHTFDVHCTEEDVHEMRAMDFCPVWRDVPHENL